MKLISFASVLTLALSGCVVESGVASEDYVDSSELGIGDGVVELVVKHSGSALTVQGSSGADGALVEQRSRAGTDGQLWRLRASSDDTVQIVNAKSQKCLDVGGASKENGAAIQQWDCWGGDNQKWRLRDAGEGRVLLESVNSGKCVDVAGWSTAEGASVVQWDCFAGPNQQIAFVASRAENHRADWMHDVKYGVMMHWFMGSKADLDWAVPRFDVNAVADQLAEAGAGYLMFTLGQNAGYFNAPNATYEEIAGYGHGEKCAARDLPMDLAEALGAKGIKLILYLPSQAPNRDPQAQRAFGLAAGETDQQINEDFARRWAKVIEEWSDRYGDKVAGWWFDGGYESIGFNNNIAQIYADAVRHGNPNAIATWNPGITLQHYMEAEDYTAGEVWEPIGVLPPSGPYLEGSQWQIQTFLGDIWGHRNTRFTNEEVGNWVKQATDRGGAVTLDIGPGDVGVVSAEQMDQLRAIRKTVKGY